MDYTQEKAEHFFSESQVIIEEFFYLSFSTQSTVTSRLYVAYEPLYFFEVSN